MVKIFKFKGHRMGQVTPYVRLHGKKENMKTAGGIESLFVRTSKFRGIKIFATSAECKRSMSRQNKAHKHKLAPQVFSVKPEQYAIEDNNKLHIGWGYVTEAVETEEIRALGWRKYEDLERKLYRELRKAGIDHGDLHNENVGYKGKKLVCIDFGDAGYD